MAKRPKRAGNTNWTNGMAAPSLAEEIRSRQDHNKVLVNFSRGKDSICVLYMCLEYGLTPYPAFYYKVPRMPFEERDLERWEDFLGMKIVRIPHPDLWLTLVETRWQDPGNAAFLNTQSLWQHNMDFIATMAKREYKLPYFTHVMDGMRSSESIQRRQVIDKTGAFTGGMEYPRCHLIHDWKDTHIREFILGRGIKLPPDYDWIGRSFDGLKHIYTKPIKDNSSEDWAYLLDLFPLLELEMLRYEELGGPRNAGTGRVRKFHLHK